MTRRGDSGSDLLDTPVANDPGAVDPLPLDRSEKRSSSTDHTWIDRLRDAAAVLEAIDADRGALAGVSPEDRQRLLRAARQVTAPDPRARRRLVKATARWRKAERLAADDRTLATTGIRELREKPVFDTPPPLELAPRSVDTYRELDRSLSSGLEDNLDDPGDTQTGTAEPLREERNCYVCKGGFTTLHAFYDQLCPACATLNYEKRFATADLVGRVALLTGGRVKIGYQIGLKLLRAGATLLVTTRFPRDAAARYAAEPDFANWASRLAIYGVDLRHTPSVESFCQHLLATRKRLDIVVNNACQTVRRPPAFYEHMMAGETTGWSNLPEAARGLLGAYEGLRATDLVQPPPHVPERQGMSLAEPSLAAFPGITHAAALSQLTLLPEDLANAEAAARLFPVGQLDQDLQQVDLRGRNSWRLDLAEVSSVELLEVQLVNAVAPFVLNARLKPLMLRTPERDKHIVNVSAVEGQFYRSLKTTRHPHTNMAKAALNMMTRTSAADYQRDGIHMNSVDTGWVTDEDPAAIAERKRLDHRFHPPLDIVDGAARVLDPVFTGFNTGEHAWGRFFKDYRPTHW